METTLCVLGAASNHERCYRVVQMLGYHFRDHCMHLYAPVSRFNFCNFLHGAPKQCKQLQLNCAYMCIFVVSFELPTPTGASPRPMSDYGRPLALGPFLNLDLHHCSKYCPIGPDRWRGGEATGKHASRKASWVCMGPSGARLPLSPCRAASPLIGPYCRGKTCFS